MQRTPLFWQRDFPIPIRSTRGVEKMLTNRIQPNSSALEENIAVFWRSRVEAVEAYATYSANQTGRFTQKKNASCKIARCGWLLAKGLARYYREAFSIALAIR